MHPIRRLLALVLQVLLLQVSVLGGGLACARGEMGAPAATGHAAVGHHATMPHAPSAPSGPSAPAHDHGAAHCAMAGSCNALLDAAPTLDVSATIVAVARPTPLRVARLRSATIAPEPPPPRG